MPRPKKEYNLNARPCPNGKFYTKFETNYIGTLTEDQLEVVKKTIAEYKDKWTSKEMLNHFQMLFVDKKRGKLVSKGMRKKEYTVRLSEMVIAKNNELAKHFQCTEDEMLTKVINDKYNEVF